MHPALGVAMPEELRSTTPGRLRLLVVDTSKNHKGFEHAMTDTIFYKIKEAGVQMATAEAIKISDDNEYYDIFDDVSNFNTILIVTHGGDDPGDGRANPVRTASGRNNWFYIAGLSSNLKNKLVCLAVCHGYCEDAIQAFLNGDLFALTLVGSKTKLNQKEAIEFFPPFFEELNDYSTTSIDPNIVKLCVNNNNDKASNKISVYSNLLSS